MKFGAPLLTSDLSGSLSGVTASKARGGIGYFRARTKPGNPRTFAQSFMRAILVATAALWRGTLTDTNRATWSAIAGPRESGIDVFVKSNTALKLAGGGVLATAPASLALPATVIATADFDASDDTLTIDRIQPANTAANVFISAPQRSSRASRQFGFSYAGTMQPADDTLIVPADHPAHFAVAGDVIYVRIVQVGVGGSLEGQVSTEQVFRVVVVA